MFTERALIAFHSNDTRRTNGALLTLRTGFAGRAIRTRRTRGSVCAVEPVLTRRTCLAPKKKKPTRTCLLFCTCLRHRRGI